MTTSYASAFPTIDDCGSGPSLRDPGMTLRQYAAISLRVPDSGLDWLDEMIRVAERRDMTGKVLAAMIVSDEHADSIAVADAAIERLQQ